MSSHIDGKYGDKDRQRAVFFHIASYIIPINIGHGISFCKKNNSPENVKLYWQKTLFHVQYS